MDCADRRDRRRCSASHPVRGRDTGCGFAECLRVGRTLMCRNIKTLHNYKPPTTEDEIRASSLQFVRKLSGFTRPSKAQPGCLRPRRGPGDRRGARVAPVSRDQHSAARSRSRGIAGSSPGGRALPRPRNQGHGLVDAGTGSRGSLASGTLASVICGARSMPTWIRMLCSSRRTKSTVQATGRRW